MKLNYSFNYNLPLVINLSLKEFMSLLRPLIKIIRKLFFCI